MRIYIKCIVRVLLVALTLFIAYQIITIPTQDNTIAMLQQKDPQAIAQFVDILKSQSGTARNLAELNVNENWLPPVGDSNAALSEIYTSLNGEIQGRLHEDGASYFSKISIDSDVISSAWEDVNDGDFDLFHFRMAENGTAQLCLIRLGNWENYGEDEGRRCQSYRVYWQEDNYPEPLGDDCEPLYVDNYTSGWYYTEEILYNG